MSRLPGDLAAPLRFEEPGSLWPWLAALLLALLLFLWLRRLLARRAAAPPAVAAPPPAPAADGGLAAAIGELRQRLRGDPRRGCHELAALLRGYASAKIREGLEYLTAREIRGAIGDTALSRLFLLVAELQFGRRPPTARDFDGACELALEVTTGRRARSRRRRRGRR